MSATTINPQVEAVKEKKKTATKIIKKPEEKVDPYAYTSMYRNIVR